MCGQDTAAWFCGLPTGTERVEFREGCQQGGVVSMFLCCALITHPFFQQLRDTLVKKVLVSALQMIYQLMSLLKK